MLADVEDVNWGKPKRGAAAKGVVTAVLRMAGDKLAATKMRLRGPEHVTPPHELAAAWRESAAAGAALPEGEFSSLCTSTLAGWSRLSLSHRILCLDAWGFIQAKQKTTRTSALPRPLLRNMAHTLWAENGAASVFELNLCAVRTGPFFMTEAADLARSMLDAVIHACAERVRADFKLSAAMGPVISMAAHASRTRRVQMELHLLRSAAADAVNPLEEAIYRRIAWTKHAFACDSFTAHTSVAASLARDSMQAHGGNLRATFIKAFGCAPDKFEAEAEAAMQTPPPAGSAAAAEDALEEWRHRETRKLVAAAAAAAEEAGGIVGAAGGAGRHVEPSALSICTVHSDGRSDAATSPR